MNDKIEILRMPKLGMSMTEGKITEWYYNVGDSVNSGDEIVEVTTEKITNTVCCNSHGIVHRILIKVDEMASVETALAVIADAGISDADIDRALAD